ncbi:MAG TPA: AraC family transcriptional regulator [Candidatus Acidoferrum sp.]|nr:AraC family transcriptional regulator [Candidatus Acidoferrum sp.]
MEENGAGATFYNPADARPVEGWSWYARNLILNDCLHNHPPEIMGAILHSFGTALNADPNNFYFLLTGLKKRVYHSVYQVDAGSYMDMYFEIEGELKRILEKCGCAGDFFMVYEGDCKQIALIFSPSGQCDPQTLAGQVCGYVQRYYETHLFKGDRRYCNFAALSEPQTGLSGIRRGFHAARAFCDLDFFIMEPRTVTGRQIAEMKNGEDYRKIMELCRILDLAMVAGDEAAAAKCLDALFLDRLKYAFSFPLCRDALSFLYHKLDLHLTVYDMAEDYALEPLCNIDSYITIEECRDALLAPVLALCRQVKARGCCQSVVQHAMYYIRHHYAQPITLPLIAENAGVSPNYLSGIFGKEAGIPLRDYVTRVRMEAAKTLLRTTGMRTYQVAGAVGIENAKYFGRLFRRHTGQSPQAFRKGAK